MPVVFLTTTGAGTYTIPAGWTSATIETIGGGAGSSVDIRSVSYPGAGGGGAYSSSGSISVTPGTVCNYHVGAGGPPSNGSLSGGVQLSASDGGDSWFATNNTATVITSSGVVSGAKGGKGPTTGNGSPFYPTGGVGGQASVGVGSIKFNGGNGGSNGFGTGAGGAAGPLGPGGAGGDGNASQALGGGGGGGNGGGATGGVGGTNGGNGGNNFGGTGGGAGGMGDGADGTNGGGGAGGGSGSGAVGNAGKGGNGTEWDGTHGSGGGGGAPGNAGGNSNSAGHAGLYGGGAGPPGAALFTNANTGGQGIIVITGVIDTSAATRMMFLLSP